MAKKSGTKGTIILDFLAGVIITLVIFVGLLTYINISSRKKNSIKEISRAAKYIAVTIDEAAREAIIYGNTRELEKKMELLDIENQEDIYAIKLDQIKTENKLKSIFSSRKTDKKKTTQIEGIKTKLKEKPVIEGESHHDEVHTYDFIYTIKYQNEVLGMLSVIFSLEKLDKDVKNVFMMDLGFLVFSILLIIVLTTFILNKRIYQPIDRLRLEVRKIKEGEVAYKVGLKENNELKLLADEINEMKTVIWSNNVDDRFANPITGLPGFLFILEKINEKIENDEFFSTCAINIKYTDPFVLYYGLSSGEEILRLISRLLDECLEDLKIEDKSVSQIRENHYMLTVDPEKAKEFGEILVERFDQEVLELYRDKEDGEQISFETKNGDEVSHPMISIIVTEITNKLRGEIRKYKDIEDKILEVEKYYSDAMEGSIFISYEEFSSGKSDDGLSSSMDLGAAEDDDAEDLLEGLGLDD